MYKMMLLVIAASLAGCGSTSQAPVSSAAANQATTAQSIASQSATSAAKPDSQAVAGTGAKEPAKAEFTCRTERPLGTRFGKKSCRTVEQMAADKQEARQALSRDGGQ